MGSDNVSTAPAAILSFDLPGYNDIPDIGLFLEQTVKYINGYLAPLGDVSLTNSMVSNYVKKKIIANPIKKQYGREQIAYLFFIAAAKTCLSLENLQKLIGLQKTYCSCEDAYEYFRNELKKALYDVFRASAPTPASAAAPSPSSAAAPSPSSAAAPCSSLSAASAHSTPAGEQSDHCDQDTGTAISNADIMPEISPEKELLHKTAVAIAYQVYLTYSIAAIE